MHYEENLRTWNELANAYKDKFNPLSIYHATYDYFCSCLIKEDARILDVGCGPATITHYLYQKNNHFQLVGTDIAPNMIAVAKSTLPQAEFLVLDTRELPLLKQSFDGIICGFCLPYIDPIDVERLFKDFHGLLNPKGILYLSFVAGDSSQSGYIVGSTGLQTYFYYHSLQEIKDLLLGSNFKLLHYFEIPYSRGDKSEFHNVLVVQKS